MLLSRIVLDVWLAVAYLGIFEEKLPTCGNETRFDILLGNLPCVVSV